MAYLQRQSVTTLSWAFFFFHHGITTDWNKYRYQVIWMLIDPKRNAWTKGRHSSAHLHPHWGRSLSALPSPVLQTNIYLPTEDLKRGTRLMVSTSLRRKDVCSCSILSCWAGCALPYRNHKLRTVRAHAWECDPTPSSGCQLGQAALTCCSGSGMSGV